MYVIFVILKIYYDSSLMVSLHVYQNESKRSSHCEALWSGSGWGGGDKMTLSSAELELVQMPNDGALRWAELG